jgi:hypothetical protein
MGPVSKLETFDRLCQEISAILTAGGVTKKELLASLPKVRERLYRERYGKKAAEGTKVRRSRKK